MTWRKLLALYGALLALGVAIWAITAAMTSPALAPPPIVDPSRAPWPTPTIVEIIDSEA